MTRTAPQSRAAGRPRALARLTQDDTGHRMRLYGIVGDWLDGFTDDEVADLLEGVTGPLTVHVNSPGGVVFQGMAIHNALTAYEGDVRVVVDGLAASMASVIAMAGTVAMYPGSMMMIHNPWNIVLGDAQEMRKNADTLDKVRDSLLAIYEAKTGQDRDTLTAMMDEETWLTADEALEWGFADEIISAEPAVEPAAAMAGLNLSVLPNINDRVAQAVARHRIAGVPRETRPAEAAALRNQEVTDMGDNTVDPKASATPTAEKTPEQIRDDAVRAERARSTEIRRCCRIAKLDDDFAARLVEEGISVETAKDRIFDALHERQDDVEITSHVRAVPGEDAREKYRRAAASAMLIRAGHAPNDGQNEFRGYSLRELARHSLEIAGVNTGGMDPRHLVGMAFTHSTSDFDQVLADVLNKELLRGWDEAPETFDRWTRRGTLTDFRAAKRVGLNLAPGLLEVPEGGEYKYGTTGDRGESITLATYGRMLSITRQAIINDDLEAFTRIPAAMGRAARRTVGNLVYAVLTGNPTMADGTALFHADHSNLVDTGSGAAPSTATFDTGRTTMATQADPDGNATGGLNIRPAFAVVPVALEGAARVVVDSETEIAASQNNSRRPNSVRGMVEVVSDARLDTASTQAWYLAADPNMHDTIEVAYLDGVDTPFLEERMGWNVDGTEFKVRIDAAAKALDHRGLFKNAGA